MAQLASSSVPGFPGVDLMLDLDLLLRRTDVTTNPLNSIPRINPARDALLDPLTGLPIVSGGGSGADGAYVFSGFTGNDDTTLFQQFLDDMAATALAAKRQLRIVLPKNSRGLIGGAFLRSNLDLDLNGSTLVKIANGSGNMFTSSTVSLLRTGPWAKNGNTWYGNADNITVRNGTLDANNKDQIGVLDLHGVRNFLCDGLTIITSQWSRNWAIRGGGFATMLNGRILGQAGLFQDGAHWQYGSVLWDNWFIEAGDDALAAGDDAVNTNVYMDDVGLDSFVARNIRVVSARGAALKVYTPQTKAFSAAPNNYTKTGRVKNVDVQVTGKSGLLRNGGVAVFSHAAAGFRNPDDLRNVRVHVGLEIGTAGNAVWDAVSGVIVGNPTAVTAADPVVVTLNGHGLPAGKVVFLAPAIGGMSNLNGFYQVRNPTTNNFQLSDTAYRNTAGLNGTGFLPWTTGSLISVGSGTGYAVGDELIPAGGTLVRPAKYLVTQVSQTGAVEAIRRLDEGDYSVLPATPNTPTGGSGTGCTLHLFLQHDGVNAFGSHTVAAKNVLITGEMLINDTTGAATRFRAFEHTDSEGVVLNVTFPVVPANGGLIQNESALQLSKKNVINCRMVCGPTFNSSMAPIMLANSADTIVSGSIENVPANQAAVVFPFGGNSLHQRPIVDIAGASNSVFQVAHGNWKAGQIVRIYNNVLSTGSLDGYYVIRRVYGDSSFGLRTLAGAQVGLGAATVTTLGNIEVANNTAKLVDLTITPLINTDGHSGINAASNSPFRVSALSIIDCNLVGVATPIGPNVVNTPCGYVNRDNRL